MKKALIPIFWLIVILLLVSTVFHRINIYDEAIGYQGALCLLSGKLPYRDFWTVYGVGHFAFLAAIIKTFGYSIDILRVAYVVLFVAFIYLYKQIAAKILDSRYVYLAVFLAALWLSVNDYFGKAIFIAVFILFANFFLLYKYVVTKKNSYMLLSGLLSVLIAYFRHEMIITFWGMFFQAFFFFTWTFDEAQGMTIWQRVKFGLKTTIPFWLGSSFIIPLLIFWWQIPTNDLISQLYEFPVHIYSETRSIPFPNPLDFIYSHSKFDSRIREGWLGFAFFTPALIYLIAIINIIRKLIKKQITTRNLEFVITMILFNFGLNLYTQALVFSDFERIFPTTIVAVILLGYSLKWNNIKYANMIFYAVCLFLISVPLSIKAKQLQKFLVSWQSWDIPIVELPREDPERVKNLLATKQFITNNTKAEEPIFVCNLRNDKLFLNDIIFYQIANRKPATKYYELHPNVANTAPVQKEIISDLQRNKVNYIIKEDLIFPWQPNESSVSKKVYLLDKFIDSNYTLAQTYGVYLIYKRKS